MPQQSELRPRYCPACGAWVSTRFRPGPGRRPDARCPHCRSLERHRFLAVLLDALRPALGEIGLLLDIAPTPVSTPLLRDLRAATHLRLDLGLDHRQVDVLGSLTELPVATGSVDVLVCYHVLEHVPEDRRAMTEIARVLSPTGMALLQVPWKPGHPTQEDPDAAPDERLRRFGQTDHVRVYGDDFETRLREAGLDLQRVTPRELLGSEIVTLIRAAPDESVWIARPAGSSPFAIHVPQTLSRMVEALVGRHLDDVARQHESRRKIRRLRARIARLRAANQALRHELTQGILDQGTPRSVRLARELRALVRRRGRQV